MTVNRKSLPDGSDSKPREEMSTSGAEIVEADPNAPNSDAIATVSGRISKELLIAADHETALRPLADLAHVEYRNGFPIISAEDYVRMYNTDIRALGAHGTATFNFQGYVREDREGYESRHGESFRDTLTTNGILKGKGHSGIHVGTDGIVAYSEYEQNRKMRGPQDIGEYRVYIRVPTVLQREKGVVIEHDGCKPASEYNNPELNYKRQEDYARKYTGRSEANDSIEIGLGLNPKRDKQARRKVEIVHMRIVHHLESGKPIYEIEEMVSDLLDKLSDLPEEQLKKEYPLLGQ